MLRQWSGSPTTFCFIFYSKMICKNVENNKQVILLNLPFILGECPLNEMKKNKRSNRKLNGTTKRLCGNRRSLIQFTKFFVRKLTKIKWEHCTDSRNFPVRKMAAQTNRREQAVQPYVSLLPLLAEKTVSWFLDVIKLSSFIVLPFWQPTLRNHRKDANNRWRHKLLIRETLRWPVVFIQWL